MSTHLDIIFHVLLLYRKRPLPPPPHPAGIVLTRPGYYTDPSMDELAQLTDDNGHCVVENFAVGREGYGNVFFEGITDVTGLNLDDIGIY